MRRSIFHRLSSVLWGGIVLLIVLLAVYVSLGRMLSTLTGSYQREILQVLNERLPFSVDAERVTAEWHSFTPSLVLQELQLTMPGETRNSIALAEGRIALDVAGSLRTRSPRVTLLTLKGLFLSGELDADGSLRLRGFGADDSEPGAWLKDFLLNVERVSLTESQLLLTLPGGGERRLAVDLALARDGSRRQLTGTLASPGGITVSVLGDGTGDPLDPGAFSGQLYLDLAADNVENISDLWGDLAGHPEVRVAGRLGLELWSSWDYDSRPRLSLRLAMTRGEFAGADNSWRVPFDRLAVEAELERRDDTLAANVSDLQFVGEGESLLIPRLQLQLRGQTLHLLAQSIALSPLSTVLAGTGLLPEPARQVLTTLNPRGTLTSLQLAVTDVSAPAQDWEIKALFRELATSPWQGAPGVEGASGYVLATPGAATAMLDSQQFSLDFPTVYAQPLHYDDFLATVQVGWNAQAVDVSSGLVEARGEEGEVRALFSLSISLLEDGEGPDMDLLVGLGNSSADYRDKYIPQVLDEDLRDWLKRSIGSGGIDAGGFLWRGSLADDPVVPHTVQLFFNVKNTSLAYHPDWPAVTDVNGTVLIDDSRVSVWADQSALLDSRVQNLSVEIWPEGEHDLWLAVNGEIRGPAADGLKVLNESPLRQYTGGMFAGSTLTGQLETQLALSTPISGDGPETDVRLNTRFADVALHLEPGGLPLQDINGELDYSTASGFRSGELAATLWGEPVRARLSQRAAVAGGDPTLDQPSAVVLDATTSVTVKQLAAWLGADSRGHARGRAGLSVSLVVPAGQPSALSIDSDLTGVGLDLPAPWSKAPAEPRPLHLDLDFGDDSFTVDLSLGGGLSSRLEFADNRLLAAAVGLHSDPPELRPGLLRVSGRADEVDTAEWEQFLRQWLPAEGGEAIAEEDTLRRLTLSIEDLQVDALLVGGKPFGAAEVSALEEEGGWQVSGGNDWLRGVLRYRADGGSTLDIAFLDLAGLDALAADAGQTAQPGEEGGEPAVQRQVLELPPLAVTVQDLRYGETALGNLAFELDSDGADIRARNVSGQLAAMQIRSQEPASLVWHQGPVGDTELDASLHFRDLGQTLAQLGYQQVIVTEEGSLRLALDWPGGPQDFALAQSRGSLQLAIGEGHFPDVSAGASGTMRVVNILNLAEIVQRLSLSQMFESGIPFNAIEGEVRLQAGTLEIPGIEVQGGSSFQFSGVSDVATRSLDGELVVTLPVANNLPWVVALTAGLPVAAGVFVLSKVFENPLNRLTSAVYRTSGTWDDPKIKFDRVFDDTTPVTAPSATATPLQPGSP